MKTAYIFHDAFSDQFSDWYPWMKTQLELQGYLVVLPTFPTPGGQSYESWKAVIKNYIPTFDSETIFIGHGTGGAFALRLLEEFDRPIAGLFLVSSYAEPIGHNGYDRVNQSFVTKPFAWDAITARASVIEIFVGSDDPFVPMAVSEHLAEHLGQDLVIIPEGGHLNKASGFSQAVPIAQGINERMKQIEKSIVIEEVPEEPRPILEQPLNPSVSAPATSQTIPVPGAIHAHTMYEDMSKLVSSNTGKVASSLLGKAREDEEVRKATSPISTRNILYIAGTLILLFGILGMGFYLFQQYAPASRKVLAPQIPSVLPAETHVRIDASPNQPSYQFSSSIDAALGENLEESIIKDFYYVTSGSRTPFGTIVNMLGITTMPEGFAAQVPAPTTALPTFMHGATRIGESDAHFIVVRIEKYDAVFALLKLWEPTMFRDLGIFMHVPDAFLRTQTNRAAFSDEVVANRNVRTLRYTNPALLDENGEILVTAESELTPYEEGDLMLGYFFLNERTLVIVDNLELVPTLITRWANSQIY